MASRLLPLWLSVLAEMAVIAAIAAIADATSEGEDGGMMLHSIVELRQSLNGDGEPLFNPLSPDQILAAFDAKRHAFTNIKRPLTTPSSSMMFPPPSPPNESGSGDDEEEGGERRRLPTWYSSMTGWGSRMNCGSHFETATYPEHTKLCTYNQAFPYSASNTDFACYCKEEDFLLEPTENCECIILMTFGRIIDWCNSASIIPTDLEDGSFQVQYDCSNIWETIYDHYEPCAGRDEDGACFDIYSVPTPTDEVVITGSFSDLICDYFPNDDGKFRCESPRNPPPGFPYQGTDSFVGLLCDTTEPSEECDCFVAINTSPATRNNCRRCSLVSNGDDDTYQISYDCSNFYDVGDCVKVDENGDCFGASIPTEGSCQGSTPDGIIPCDGLFTRDICTGSWDGPHCFGGNVLSACEERCEGSSGCYCDIIPEYSYGTEQFSIQCSGTTTFDCTQLTTFGSCLGQHETFGCNWVEEQTSVEGACPLERAIAIPYDSINGVRFVRSTTGAPATVPEVFGCNPIHDSPTNWYKFTPTKSDTIALTTCSGYTSYDTIVIVYRVDSVDDCSLECVGSNDDHFLDSNEHDLCSESASHSLLFIDGIAGETYYVAVTGYFSSSFGTFYLLIQPLLDDVPAEALESEYDDEEEESENEEPESEDDCPVTIIESFDYDSDGISIRASTSTAFPLNLPSSGICSDDADEDSPTRWFSFEADADGPILITTCSDASDFGSTTFDTVLSVFEGDPEDCDFDCVEENDDHDFGDIASFCDDDDHSIVVFDAEEGETYYIAVSGTEEDEQGEFLLVLYALL